MTDWLVADLAAADRDRWEQLYSGYGTFYEVAMPPAKLALVWSWLHDADHELRGLVVRADPASAPVGLAHYRPFARPLHGSVGCYLDDLFVDPAARGSGAARALLAELRRRAAADGRDVVRWITRSSNSRARDLYDRLAVATDLLTYDMAVQR
jgi:ribosomal protein S18 acetylase RimI-like enzyme